jgi:hypothetical protein
MFRHVAMYRWRPDASAADKAAVVDGLAALPDAIPGIDAYRFGPDAGIAADNWDFVVVADFADEDGYLVYRDHPRHRVLATDVILPAIAARAAVQYAYDA